MMLHQDRKELIGVAVASLDPGLIHGTRLREEDEEEHTDADSKNGLACDNIHESPHEIGAASKTCEPMNRNPSPKPAVFRLSEKPQFTADKKSLRAIVINNLDGFLIG
jgi:hypothetical protein